MAQKIKLELTAREAKTLANALDAEMAQLAKMIKETSPIKDYLFHKHLVEQYRIASKILGLIEEPYLV